MKTFRYILLSSRPISWLNTAYPFAAGYVMTSQSVSWQLIIGSLYFLFPYNLLMYGINDVFDYDSDVLNPRKGGLEGAKLAKAQHRAILWSALLINLPFIFVMLTWGNVWAKIVLLVALFMVLAYSVPGLRFKERPFVDSITSSSHFVGPLVYGLVLVGWQLAFWPYVLAFFLWGMASHAFGAVQDIPSDRAGNIKSIGTFLGARATTRLAASLYLACSLMLAMQGVAGIICALLTLLYVANIYPYLHITDKTAETANSGWRRFIWLNWFVGFCITMLLIATYNN